MTTTKSKVEPETIDILQMELDEQLPYWLSPAVKYGDSAEAKKKRDEIYKQEWEKIVGSRGSKKALSRSNPHHEPAGSPSGGQFAPGDGGGGGGGGGGGSGEVSGDKPAGGQADHKVFGSGKNREMIEGAVRSLPSHIYERVKDVSFFSQPVIDPGGGKSVAGRYNSDQSTIRVADTAGDRKVKGPIGVLYHEVGHAIDDRMGLLSSKLSSMLIADADRMKPGEKYLAKYWINHGPRELFSEAFRVAYSTDKKGGFSMGQKRAEKVFAKSIAAIREAIG